MAKTAHASSDIWHHSLEDLLKAIETGDTAASPASFAITLQTSTTPIGTPVAAFPRFERLHIYQLTHLASDRSARFQLRLGIIESDLEADAILATVRKYYPQAIKATVNDADRTAIAQAVSTAKTKAVVVPPPKVSPTPAVASPVVVAPKAEVPVITDDSPWNIDELLPELATPNQQRPARLPRNAPTAQQHQTPPSLPPRLPVLKAATLAETPTKAVAVQIPAAPARQEEPRKPIALPGPPMAPVRAAVSPPTAIRPALPIRSKSPKSEMPAATLQPRRIDSASGAARRAAADGKAPATRVSGVQDLRADEAKSVQPMIRAAPVPTPTSTSDSGTLQSLVDKIDTLIYAVELRAEQRTVAQKVAAPGPVPIANTAPPVAPSVSAGPKPVTSRPPSANTNANTQNIQKAPAAIDSTQTIRALTAVELEDAEASQWFVVELMQSQGQIEPEQIPKLDIFAEYRLYSVSETEEGVPLQLLRLGFFSSEIAAYAVAGYLSSHFPTKQIKRVSIAERDRFAEQAVEAKKEVGEAGRHTVIEVTALPEIINTLGPRAASEDEARGDAPSLWSRLTRFRGS